LKLFRPFSFFALVCGLLGFLVLCPRLLAQDSAFHPRGEQIDLPLCAWPPDGDSSVKKSITCTEHNINEWLLDLTHWRHERKIRIGYDPAEYAAPETLWTQSSLIQTQMMVHDRFFYDATTHAYTVDRYLNDLVQRYGGIDSVLVWHVYPNLGVDDRNQFDLLRDLPGGLDGIRQMIGRFHARGVRVLLPVVLWDQGTRPSGENDWDALARQLTSVGADGVNGDTLEGVPQAYQQAFSRVGRRLVAEPEAGVASNEMLKYNQMSWAYFDYAFPPPLSLYKWLEPRHMVHVCNRWAHDHTDDLQAAFFNGAGFESWENIWGIWNQMTPRDAESLRRLAAIERAEAPLLASAAWEPNIYVHPFGVFASKWPSEHSTLWTIVNRNAYSVGDVLFDTPTAPGARYFDLWHGVELHAKVEDGKAAIQLELEPNGYGAVLETRQDKQIPTQLLATMLALSQKPLSAFSKNWTALTQTMTPIAPTAPPASAPQDMIQIPAADYEFQVHGIEIEGMNDQGVDVQYQWEDSPRRYHARRMHIDSFWIDKYPVTNAEFKRFLDATHYHPADDHNFLKDWSNGTYPAAAAKRPVTWVSLDDARAYAAWAGKRLPHEWEWQYSAQGLTAQEYTWGKEPLVGIYTQPTPDKGRMMAPASPVDAFPKGASPFGVMDMTGNVWQWTDEFVDQHTRAAIVRGGSHYEPQGSRWYFPKEEHLSEHGKYLLMSPGMDRSGAIGFRCVMDATSTSSAQADAH
jgi:gamma-glutamyl hercynylcysteine S-oxide synthase